MEMLEAVIEKGSHHSALQPNAAGQLHHEGTLEKVAQGYARLVTWEEIENNLPINLKISPIAAIPHKSHSYHMILDLLCGVQLGKIYKTEI